MACGLSCGIVGLPNVGKSTLFNALTSNRAPAANYPFCTIDPNVGVVEVIDPRLQVLSNISSSKKILYATLQFVDIAGLVKGAASGEGLGNQFLSNIRETDAIIHVVRCFEGDVIHVSGSVDPIRDVEIIDLELILADLQMAENSLQRLEKQAKGKKELLPFLEALKKVSSHLNLNLPVRSLELSLEEKELLKPYPFLTAKKVLYVANVGEEDFPKLENPHFKKLEALAKSQGNRVIPISSRMEEEILDLSLEERKAYLETFGLKESGLNRLIKTSYEMLGLITFLTTGEMETRAWTIPHGAKAPEAAGKIHTDLQKGFIRAEVVPYDDFVACGGRAKAREMGKLRAEGKEYVVKDGDVILFMHN